MEAPSPTQLKNHYHSFLEQKNWDGYVSALCEEGLQWWFNMEIPCIASHLAPLSALPQKISIPTRLVFLKEAVEAPVSIERLEGLYHTFILENDLEAASAVAGTVVASIADSGADYERFDTWHERITRLLETGDQVSPLARASLLGFKAFVEHLGWGNLAKAAETYQMQLAWAEKAGSASLRVFCAGAYGHSLMHAGDISRAEVILLDAAPLSELPETPLLSKAYFQIALGVFYIIKVKIGEAKRALQETIEHPLFDRLPGFYWLLGIGNLLLALCIEGDTEGIEAVSKRMQQRAIPEGNHYFHGYLHYNLGVASLTLGRPHRALHYARESMARAQRSGSPIPEHMVSLLLGQALADLNKDQEALDHLVSWLERCQKGGFNIVAVSAALEISYLLVKMGKMDQAREYYEKASRLVPQGERIPWLYRPAKFLENLKRSLHPGPRGIEAWADTENAGVRIQTFGELRVQIRDRTLYDRRWRGGRTKTLLKALIVFGGTRVPEELLVDTLWPETEGDRAMGNLKVAILRLRRAGSPKGEEPLPWIMVRHKHVSLARSLCSVDSIRFQEVLKEAFEDKDNRELLQKALDLYREDFLARDTDEAWIVRHREVLRGDYVKGAVMLSRLCLEAGKAEEALPYLQRAVEKDPLHEPLYAHLMRCHIEMGYSSGALQVFKQAQEALQRELGIAPGASLRSLAREAGGEA